MLVWNLKIRRCLPELWQRIQYYSFFRGHGVFLYLSKRVYQFQIVPVWCHAQPASLYGVVCLLVCLSWCAGASKRIDEIVSPHDSRVVNNTFRKYCQYLPISIQYCNINNPARYPCNHSSSVRTSRCYEIPTWSNHTENLKQWEFGGRQPLLRQSQSTAGRVGSVHDFLAGSGRVNRNGSDVLELGYSSGNLRNNNPTQLFRWPAASWVKKGGQGRGDTVNFWQNSRESCKFPTKIIGACPEFSQFLTKIFRQK